METNPKVAIMMPVYNGEENLPLVIKSLVNQSYKNWSCYIVNDGSTDGTRYLLDNLNDDRFKVIHFTKNKGRAVARQAILDMAQGQYLSICDADDFYHPDRLMLQVAYLEKNPEVHLVSCGVASYKNLKEGIIRVRGNLNLPPRYFEIGDRERYIHVGSMLRLADAKKVSYNPELRYAEDMDFLERYLNGRKYALMPEVLYYYSEFESVTKNKKIKTYFYNLTRLKNSSRSFGQKAKAYRNTIVKLGINFLLYPFVSSAFYLNRIGKAADNEMKNEFNSVVSLLMND